MSNLLHFTINVRKSHRQLQCTLQLVCKDLLFFVWFDLHVFMRAEASKCERALHLVYPYFVIKRHSSSNPTNKNLTEFGLSITVTNQNYTSVHTNFFLQWPILSPPKILTFPPKSPCIQPVIAESNISTEYWYNVIDRGNLRYSGEHLS